MTRKILIAGNWKMNGLSEQLSEVRAIADGLGGQGDVSVLVCPPATLIRSVRDALEAGAHVGGQNCHFAEKGAHTGEISAAMLKDAGASHVILGHSERRTDHGEASELVRRKLAAAHAAGLVAVVCVGETLAERETGETLPVLARQLADSLGDAISPDDTVIAYEPVWAIGTGKTPTPDEVAEVHAFIRRTLAERFGEALAGGIRLLYGGSVQPGNAATLLALPDVDGALVGGASLKAKDFLAICEAARNCR